MTQAALNGAQKAADFDVTSRDLNLDDFVVLFLDGKCLSLLGVDVRGDFLSQTVSRFAKLLVVAADLVRVVAVSTLACVHLEVVQCPTLSVVY